MELPLKVLFLEDDEFTRNITTAQLERAGLEVNPIATTESLLSSNLKDYDLLITDLNINGDDIQQIIAKVQDNGGTPIVVLSQAADQKGLGDLYLGKPLDQSKIHKILKLLERDKIDITQVAAFACGDEDLIHSHLAAFVQNFSKDLQLLITEVKLCAPKVLKDRAHKMLSSVSYYKNAGINSLLKRLESDADKMEQGEREALVQDVQEVSNRLMHKLDKMISTATLG